MGDQSRDDWYVRVELNLTRHIKYDEILFGDIVQFLREEFEILQEESSARKPKESRRGPGY